jgi:hypothetical protein
MALNYTSEKLALENAERFKNSFSDSDPSIQYVFIGNHTPYANESSPPSIVETISSEKLVWDNMFAAKRVTANDVELVIPRVNWTANTKYRQYDDTIALSDLITGNTSQNLKPFYIITSAKNVYKCLSNNFSANSTVEPIGDYSTSNGAISTADGYIWKYMFNVKSSNKFLNTDWIPTPTRNTQASTLSDFNLDDTGVVEGELTTVVISNGGTGYYNSTVNVTSFITGCSILTVANTTNVAANMTVSGTGIPTGTVVSVLDTPNNKITLSSPATANGGGTGNNLSFATRIYFDGDGTSAAASATLANGAITKITLTTIGIGYSRANVLIFGSGTGANARAIIAPKYGHAKSPAKDLLAKNVEVTAKIGEVDSTENGLISVDTSFRQFGLLRNPHKYGQAAKANNSTANSVISQARTLTLTPGPSYTLNEYVSQVTANNTVAYGFVYSQTASAVKITQVQGTFVVGLSLTGATSGASRTVVASTNPEFEPYSGDVLYVENIEKIEREDGQAENVRFIIQF